MSGLNSAGYVPLLLYHVHMITSSFTRETAVEVNSEIFYIRLPIDLL